jgi:hypothetical protein
LYLPSDGIEGFIKELDKDTRAIKEDLLRICWFMRGGIPYSESLNLSVDEREIIGKIINSNLETTKESGLPFF